MQAVLIHSQFRPTLFFFESFIKPFRCLPTWFHGNSSKPEFPILKFPNDVMSTFRKRQTVKQHIAELTDCRTFFQTIKFLSTYNLAFDNLSFDNFHFGNSVSTSERGTCLPILRFRFAAFNEDSSGHSYLRSTYQWASLQRVHDCKIRPSCDRFLKYLSKENCYFLLKLLLNEICVHNINPRSH
jgi:hypothetical protein